MGVRHGGGFHRHGRLVERRDDGPLAHGERLGKVGVEARVQRAVAGLAADAGVVGRAEGGRRNHGEAEAEEPRRGGDDASTGQRVREEGPGAVGADVEGAAANALHEDAEVEGAEAVGEGRVRLAGGRLLSRVLPQHALKGEALPLARAPGDGQDPVQEGADGCGLLRHHGLEGEAGGGALVGVKGTAGAARGDGAGLGLCLRDGARQLGPGGEERGQGRLVLREAAAGRLEGNRRTEAAVDGVLGGGAGVRVVSGNFQDGDGRGPGWGHCGEGPWKRDDRGCFLGVAGGGSRVREAGVGSDCLRERGCRHRAQAGGDEVGRKTLHRHRAAERESVLGGERGRARGRCGGRGRSGVGGRGARH
mmetsp:Transcript_5532/g.23464  ORF Transcript_5532/g.23464 Transcript_5532/m.23464 type:complete len:363 (-) Transcript_5532:712-1800(-)